MHIDPNLIDNILTICKKTGQMQMEHFRRNVRRNEIEKSKNEFVTLIDIESEKIIQKSLKNLYPKIGFYGEESGVTNQSEWMWVVDPIDGTNNYINGIDMFAISIALQKNQETIVGVVYRPPNGEVFHGKKGEGAYHNGKLLPKQKECNLKDALIGTGFPYRSLHTYESFSKTSKAILENCRGLRRMGSASLDISYVAAGFLQGFWEYDLKAYDVGAAILFLEETGCCISNFKGEKYNCFKDKEFLTGHPGVYEFLLDNTQSYYYE